MNLLKSSQAPLPWIQHGRIYTLPIIHYNMEMAAQVHTAIKQLQPDCIAVELAENMSLQMLHGASRLPDVSVVMAESRNAAPLYYLCEPCDAAFEALRTGLEYNIPAFCIDLDVDFYPNFREPLPDPYAIQHIGLGSYYAIYRKLSEASYPFKISADKARETYMAKRLKELSFSYDRILFVCGMSHVAAVLSLIDSHTFPLLEHAARDSVRLCALTEQSCREVLSECGWFSLHYENERKNFDTLSTHGVPQDPLSFAPDRYKLIYTLYKRASEKYMENTGNSFPGYNMRNIIKFVRNYAITCDRLMPDLFQILCSAKGCVDHNYAYEVWELATDYPYRKNIDNLPEINLKPDEIWGNSKLIRFHLKQRSPKSFDFKRRPDKSRFSFQYSLRSTICSYQPEDIAVENFGAFLKKKGTLILTEEASRTTPFTTSIEDGIDTKETIRHWHEKKLYVKVKGKPPGGVGSVVIIFNEDEPQEGSTYQERYPWKTTWLGEHSQESDMAFYASPLSANIIGPGISRCEYGGFMMSYPSRRMIDVWNDPNYGGSRTKAELLLVAAIDYAIKPLVVYVAAKPPRSAIKSLAQRFGRKIAFIPIGQLSPITLNKIRVFHVLDGYDKRKIADEYIF